MKNIYTTKINKKIALLGIFAFAVLVCIPTLVHASNGYYVSNAPGDTNYNGSDAYNSESNYSTNTNNVAPVIYSVNPDSMTAGSTTTKVVDVTGANFSQGLIARFNGSDRPTTYYNSSHMSMVLYPSDMVTSGTYLITAYNPNNGYVSNAGYFNLNKTPDTVGTPTSTTTAGDYPPTSTKTTPKKTAKKASTTVCTNDLTANALGSGFMPSTFLEWVLLLLLVLLVIFLGRKLYLGNTPKPVVPLKKA